MLRGICCVSECICRNYKWSLLFYQCHRSGISTLQNHFFHFFIYDFHSVLHSRSPSLFHLSFRAHASHLEMLLLLFIVACICDFIGFIYAIFLCQSDWESGLPACLPACMWHCSIRDHLMATHTKIKNNKNQNEQQQKICHQMLKKAQCRETETESDKAWDDSDKVNGSKEKVMIKYHFFSGCGFFWKANAALSSISERGTTNQHQTNTQHTLFYTQIVYIF